jgi:Tol biopolymer transport system component
MATVYLAEDLKHRRKVALKVLRPELAAIIGAERFLKEIEVTANLQHPNILPLYDSGEADSFLYYVMPYVEGESLRDRLAREKQLSVDDSVALARAVAAALEYAHRHGVVHRDIKPENILLQSGQALVADFGIALAVSQAGGSRMTETGMSLGTPHYMSPEQATGDRTLDARSDIYALGCVTYEMLAGEPPYLGNTAQAIVAKILTEVPTPVRKRRPSVPVHIEAAIQMALAKLPADRFASAAEFGAALVNPGFTLPGTMALAAASAGDGRWKRRAQVAYALAAVLAIGFLIGVPRPKRSLPLPVTRVAIALARGEGLRQGPWGRFAISPDGARIAYTTTRDPGGAQLVVRERDQLHAVPVLGSETAFSPFFAPDGKSVAFFVGPTLPTPLKLASLTGAPPITVADTGLAPLGGDWGADGYLYASGSSGLVRLPATGGAAEPLTHVDTKSGQSAHAWPQLLPGGRGLLFTILRGGASQREVALLDLQSRVVTTLLRGTFARYAPTGHLIYVRDEDGALLAAPFDPARLKVTGPPVSLLDGISLRTFGVADLAFSQSGTLIYSTGASGLEHLSWVTRDGKASEIEPSWAADFITHALSPDGKRLVVSLLKEGPRDLWIKELDHGPLTRFSFEGQTNHRPEWTRDGRNITFISDRSGRSELFVQRADGNGTPQLLITQRQEARGIAEGFWSPDGKWLIYRTSLNEIGGGDILGFRPGLDSAPVPLVATRFGETEPALSPDGRWLAYVSNESGQSEVYVRPFPSLADGRWQVSVAGGREPMWAHSGREIFYKSVDDMVMVATVAAGSSLEVRDRKALFSAVDYDNDIEHARYNVSLDDQRLLMSRKTTSSETDLVLVLNWFAELKARMGAKP